MSENRQPKGIPVGGQFAANNHDEAPSSLTGDPVPWEVEGNFVSAGHHLVWGNVRNDALSWAYVNKREFRTRYKEAGRPTLMEVVETRRVPDEPNTHILMVDLGDGKDPVEVGVHREGLITIDERDFA